MCLFPGLSAAKHESTGAEMIADPIWIIFYAALVILFISMVIFFQTRNLLRTRRLLIEKEQALDQIEKQKLELETRDKNMTDSLIYAQRIQEALLPSEEYFRRFFSDSFIFFRPKDIVSGDFYWIGEKKNKIFVVAADCTGHGVPGALMSMIGLEIIDKAINEDNLQNPAAILGLMNRGLEKTFSREKNIGTIIRDGMDIGLCVIDRQKKRIEYSGAFFPLYLIRDNSLTEIKGDKLIIGMNPEGIQYTLHEVDLMDNDIIYIFSDGYIDQFGGEENKKFMYRRFRYLLTRIHAFPVDDQKSILEDHITAWMAGNPQLDDMMVLGFKPLSGSTK
ncbi:MAG: SpoIIE family protein phosphatase [Bacteroidales bacterium]|jgi:serine phosphatase RsbU (regulator of sigma subunit)|nr:SpoIIE family protein phosphatase [Bacteroidales bacterium]